MKVGNMYIKQYQSGRNSEIATIRILGFQFRLYIVVVKLSTQLSAMLLFGLSDRLQILRRPAASPFQVPLHSTLFLFYKNVFYKNIEAEILRIF